MIFLKRLLITVLFIASITQAMAGAIMPCQIMNQCELSMSERNTSMMIDSMQMTVEFDQHEASLMCEEDSSCCNFTCSMSYLSSHNLFVSSKAVQEPIQDLEKSIISVTSNIFHPPILA